MYNVTNRKEVFMLKKVGWFFTIAFLLALAGIAGSHMFDDGRTFEVRVADIAMRSTGEQTCPLSVAALSSATDLQLRACAEDGLMGYIAATQYPANGTVFEAYANTPVFHEVLDRYGPQVVPVVAYFMEHGSKMMRAQATLAELWSQLKRGGDISITPIELSPEQYGLMALLAIQKEGNGFLTEFTFLEDGSVARVQTERIWAILKDTLSGGLINLEIKMRRGERVTFRDGAMAALDGFVLAGPLTKGARLLIGLREVEELSIVSKDATIADRAAMSWDTLTATSRTVIGKAWATAKYGAPFAVVYVAVTHPSLISSGGKFVARLMRIPEWVGAVSAWSIVGAITSPILMTLWGLLKLLKVPFWIGRKLERA